MRLTWKRKAGLFLATMLVSFSILVSSTYSWNITTDNRQKNRLGGADVYLKLEEDFVPGEPPEDGLWTKKVWVTNYSDQSVFVRVMALPQVIKPKDSDHPEVLEGGSLLAADPLLFTFVYENPPGTMNPGFNTNEWIDGGDGYFYYRTALAPGQQTIPLFSGVQLTDDAMDPTQAMEEMFDGAKVDIFVKAEACPARGDTTGGSPIYLHRVEFWADETPTAGALQTIDGLYVAAVATVSTNEQ